MIRIKLLAFALTALAVAPQASAQESQRWTGAEDADASLDHVLARLSTLNGYALTAADFRAGEDRDLATSHYRRYDQILEDVTVRRMAIRVWTELDTGRLIQLEARTTGPETIPHGVLDLESVGFERAQRAAVETARRAVAATHDRAVRGLDVTRYWDAGRLVYEVKLRARRGFHEVDVDALTGQLLRSHYAPFPRADHGREQSIPALVYPVYEEHRGTVLPRHLVRLRYIKTETTRPATDPFAPLRAERYVGDLYDVVRGSTPEGRAAGYWNMAWLRGRMGELVDALPRVPNTYENGGVLLDGRYATISIHPEAFDAFPGITVPRNVAPTAFFKWGDVGEDDWEVIPTAAALGSPLADRDAALNRSAARHPTHDPAAYIKSGLDEVQVYYAINTLFESLRANGFTDPDLAERPFHAFLFDPDIESQDNAYYTDDTINFATYTPLELNMARDNTTIWHELGHGVMDRLMGDQLHLADTGGLSEGMADFVAEMVLQKATRDVAFPGKDAQRIINGTGLYLTNEVHDDGEAYGGAMKAMLDGAVARWGQKAGVRKVTDLILEAMRLSRDHPALTADGWFDHVRFADTRGRRGFRRAGELRPVIDAALASRNFLPEADRGQFVFRHAGADVGDGELGTRYNEIPLELAATGAQTYDLEIQAKDGAVFRFDWPVEVRVFFNSGPLEGAIDWDGEDQEPLVRTLAGPTDVLHLPLTVKGTCDAINRDDGTCSDFAYVQIWGSGATKPIAKKRFYVRLKTI
jgi:hypothetical protein